MDEKTSKSSKIKAFIILLFVIICVSLILLELYTNITKDLEEDSKSNESGYSTLVAEGIEKPDFNTVYPLR